ncbi:hypothetical protein PROFUN_09204 [Planoprotostelium fungivorum]|uniref:Pinin/SDK/MemA protein domain-containing protein n=1 Tax=Planoprotostelium fungivorum TaxID=1890364 RepID=A0A2P6NHL7_9EUKA|nr:hypothetical protein PROFUN_09204 [Planoprotostelium fungivorum]
MQKVNHLKNELRHLYKLKAVSDQKLKHIETVEKGDKPAPRRPVTQEVDRSQAAKRPREELDAPWEHSKVPQQEAARHRRDEVNKKVRPNEEQRGGREERDRTSQRDGRDGRDVQARDIRGRGENRDRREDNRDRREDRDRRGGDRRRDEGRESTKTESEPAPDIKREVAPLEVEKPKPNLRIEDRTRSRRVFGILQGHLQQFKKEADKKAEESTSRAEIESRVEAQVREEHEAYLKKQAAKMQEDKEKYLTVQAEFKRREAELEEAIVAAVVEGHRRQLSVWEKTTAQPVIFWQVNPTFRKPLEAEVTGHEEKRSEEVDDDESNGKRGARGGDEEMEEETSEVKEEKVEEKTEEQMEVKEEKE